MIYGDFEAEIDWVKRIVVGIIVFLMMSCLFLGWRLHAVLDQRDEARKELAERLFVKNSFVTTTKIGGVDTCLEKELLKKCEKDLRGFMEIKSGYKKGGK